jgi:hypothetical protein
MGTAQFMRAASRITLRPELETILSIFIFLIIPISHPSFLPD